MAIAYRRIIDQLDDTELQSGDYIMVDSETEGTRKYDIGTGMSGKVDKETGKGLSTEDYTTAEKTKLSEVEAQANKTIIDETLANTGQAADAKKVGDELTAVKEDLSYYTETDVSVYATAEGWRLTGTGACVEASTYKMIKYAVTEGTMLHLVLSKDATGSEVEGVYQWQNTTGVPSKLPNSGLVGEPVTNAVNDYVTVPSGATYLIVSQFKTNTTNSVKLATLDSTLKEKVEDLDGKIDSIEPGLSSDAKEALLACFEHVAWTDDKGQDYYDTLYDALYGKTYLYHFDNSLLSSGTDDFGFIGQANYSTGANGKSYYHKVATEGDASTDVGAIYKVGLSDLPPIAGDFTISLWHKTVTEKQSRHFAITKYVSDDPIYSPNRFFLNVTQNAQSGWTTEMAFGGAGKTYAGICLLWDNNKLSFCIHNASVDHSSVINMTPPSEFSSRSWHHFAVTRERQTYRFFVDGVLIFTGTSAYSPYQSNQICIGASFGLTASQAQTVRKLPYGCYIDDFFLSNKCKWKAPFDPNAIIY